MTLRLSNVRYRYPGGHSWAVGGVDLSVVAGEFMLLTGPTGCGKSTLLRLAAGLLQRHGAGTWSGEVEVDGVAPHTLPPSARVERIGFVSQTPHDQLITGTVGDEVAFGLESAGWTRQDMNERVQAVLSEVELHMPLDHPSTALSGGQTQRLVVAGAIAGRPPLLLLDEPLAQLDPQGATRLLSVLRNLANRGVAIIMVEHRVHLAQEIVDRTMVMKDGVLLGDQPVHLARVGLGQALQASPKPGRIGEVVLAGHGLRYQWPGSKSPALDGVDVSFRSGERVAIMGPNGSGKSTLLQGLAGHLPVGKLSGRGSVVDVPQDPDLALFCETTESELAYGPRERRMDPVAVHKAVHATATGLDLTPLLDRPPQALSRGQRLRTAVGAALCCEPDVLLLDEPTSGQDRTQVARMMATLATVDAHRTVVFATHDEELAAKHATRIIRLEAGQLVHPKGGQ